MVEEAEEAANPADDLLPDQGPFADEEFELIIEV